MNKMITLLVAMFLVIGMLGTVMACPNENLHGHNHEHHGHNHERTNPNPPTGGEVPGGEQPPTSPE